MYPKKIGNNKTKLRTVLEKGNKSYLLQRNGDLGTVLHVLEPDLVVEERLEEGAGGPPSPVHVPLHVTHLDSNVI